MSANNFSEQYGLEMLKQSIYIDSISNEDQLKIVQDAIALGTHRAIEIKELFGKISPEDILQQHYVSIEMNLIEKQGNPNYVKLAEFYSKKNKIILNQQAINTIGRKMDKNMVKQIILCHEMYHYFEMNKWGLTSELFIRSVKLFSIIPVKRKILPAAEIAANSFTKKYLELDFEPHLIEKYFLED